jgi:hypothetical protein
LTIEEIVAFDPHAIVVTGGTGAAARLRANPVWRTVPAVAAGRVYQWPGLPYGWGPRPPSVNRLPGLVWLAYVVQGRPFDTAFADAVRAFYRDFYHVELTEQQLRTLVGARSNTAPEVRRGAPAAEGRPSVVDGDEVRRLLAAETAPALRVASA